MNTLMLGDCLERMKEIPSNSVDAIVTDPPYELCFMGKAWDNTGIANSVEMWSECLRVLKHGGYLLSFGGTRTHHRMVVAIEDAGFEIRDQVVWAFGSGFPKSHNVGVAVDKLQGNEREVTGVNRAGKNALGQDSGWNAHENKTVFDITKGNSEWEGWGSALKPAIECICMARKPLEKGLTIAENCLKWGTGGINVDASRVATSEEITNHSRGAESAVSKGKYGDSSAQATHQTKGQTQGRFPANLILAADEDGQVCEEIRACFPETKSGAIKAGSSAGTDHTAGDVSHNRIGGRPAQPKSIAADSGNASRFFKSIIYQAKASKSERNKGCEELEEKAPQHDFGTKLGVKRDERIHTKTTNNHPTVKPVALMEYLINMVSREGATILDPFMGSGTTGVAAKNLNRNFIGIEKDADYFEIAKARIDMAIRKLAIDL